MYYHILIVVALLHIIQSTIATRTSSAALLGLSNTPVDADCKDDVCKVPSTKSATGSIKAELVDLESKILKEWKQASGGSDKKLSRAATATVSMTDDVKPTTPDTTTTTSAAPVVDDITPPAATPPSPTSPTAAASTASSASTATPAAVKTEAKDDPSDMPDKVHIPLLPHSTITPYYHAVSQPTDTL